MSDSTNIIPVTIQRDLDDVTDPILSNSLREWSFISDVYGRFDYSESLYPIFNSKYILLPSSTIIMAEGENPLSYLFAWVGDGFGVYNKLNFVGRCFGDIPDKGYATQMAKLIHDVKKTRKTTYHTVSAFIDGRNIYYHRLIFPLVEHGEVTAFLTTSVSSQYPYLRSIDR